MTEIIQSWATLLAVADNSRAVWGRFDRQKPSVGPAEWAVILGAAFLIAVVMLVSRWRAKRQKLAFLSDSSSQLFNELVRAHRLDRANRKLMKKLTVAQGTKNAATLFVEPEYFDAAKRPHALDDSAEELRHLQYTLFE